MQPDWVCAKPMPKPLFAYWLVILSNRFHDYEDYENKQGFQLEEPNHSQ